MTCQSLTRTSSLEQPTIRSTMRNRKKSGRARPNCNLQISFARVAMQMKLKRLFGRFSITVTVQVCIAAHSGWKWFQKLSSSLFFNNFVKFNLQNRQSSSNENDMKKMSSCTDFIITIVVKLACLILDAKWQKRLEFGDWFGFSHHYRFFICFNMLAKQSISW